MSNSPTCRTDASVPSPARPSRIVRVRSSEELESYLPALIACYKQVFSESAWQEWWKCDTCGAKWKYSDPPADSKCCGREVVDYYSDAEVASIMRSVFAYPAFQFLVLTLDDAIAGFMFGYEVDIDRLNAEKLGIDAIRWQTCRAAIDTLARRPISRVFYRADLGVDPAARWLGLGQRLVYTAEEMLRAEPGAAYPLRRTSRNSPMFSLATWLGYEAVFEYNDNDARVILARPPMAESYPIYP